MTTNKAAVLVLDKVSKRYADGTLAVKEVSLDIYENEFFALLGPSGCGKSTLLRMLAGFETPTGGAILLDGQDISPMPANKRPLNLMFQSYALFPNMTVRQNIAYGLEMERLDRDEINQRVEAVLDTTHVRDYANKRPDQLSGGQRQRVALARALIKRPRVLLLDEPLGALDKKLREKMQLELKRLQHESGITFIVVTHDQEEALVMADRMAVLNAGTISQYGSPSELYEKPNNRFVADFIGVSNLIDATRLDATTAQVGHHTFAITPTPEGQALTLALRPERLVVLAEGQTRENRVQGTVVEVAYHGLDTNLHVKTELSAKPLIVRVPSNEREFHTFASGMPIQLGWQAIHARVLTA